MIALLKMIIHLKWELVQRGVSLLLKKCLGQLQIIFLSKYARILPMSMEYIDI